MEAVGTLAGGIAHDFNNILQVVCGFSEIILLGKKKGDPEDGDREKVLSAGMKGADLVQRLLTFSRKSEINPKPLNLNQQIQRVGSILERTIPKIIKMDLILADGLSAITADSTQVEQVLMNLAVNARDAMPEGGRLIIETANVTLDEDYCNTHLGAKPGQYALLTVSDTGSGIDKKTLGHIFEPFFSTKDPRKRDRAGSGYGLWNRQATRWIYHVLQRAGRGHDLQNLLSSVRNGDEPERAASGENAAVVRRRFFWWTMRS